MKPGLRLEGSVALVTGGAMGIGRAVVELFAREGAHVISVDLEEETGRAVAANLASLGYRAEFVPIDVTCEDDLDRLFHAIEPLQKLDVVVNNAGVIVSRGLMDATLGDWERCISVDLKSIWRITQRAAPLMAAGGGGSIVNLSSMHGIRTSKGSFPYSTVKTAVIGLTRSMAVELGQHGIRVNAVCPGLIETRMSAAWIEELKSSGRWESLMRTHLLGRVGEPEDVAKAVLFFACADSSFITGTCLPVDGGHDAVLWSI